MNFIECLIVIAIVFEFVWVRISGGLKYEIFSLGQKFFVPFIETGRNKSACRWPTGFI